MDNDEYQSYHNMLCACYSDVANAYPAQQQAEHRRDLLVIGERGRCEGVAFFTKTLPSLAKAIDYALATGTTLQVHSFARKKGSKLPRFLGWLIGLVIQPDGTESASADPVALKYLRNLLYLFYKLELPHTTTKENEVYTTFKEVDQGLSSPWNVNEPQHKYAVKYAARLVGRLFAGQCARNIFPRHGPGSTADGAKPCEKPNFLGYYKAIQEYYPFDSYFCWSPSHVSERLSSWVNPQTGVSEQCMGLADDGPLRDLGTSTAKVVLVPKDSRGPRLISMEPLETQWIQQGQLDKMVRTIESHFLTRGHVNFSNQEVNRTLAITASAWASKLADVRTRSNRGGVDSSSTQHPSLAAKPVSDDRVSGRRLGVLGFTPSVRDPGIQVVYNLVSPQVRPDVRTNYAPQRCDLVTLDMKDASDRVSMQLVQSLFPSNWVEALEASRSPQTLLPTGEIVTLNKFAPMGSAVCFPVEAICFWALALAGIHLRNPTLPLKRLRDRVWVYGDDIICYRKDYPAVIDMLERVGLKFNVNKCCTAGSFRESCGMDAYKGIPVTPSRIARRWSHRLGVDALASYVAYSNAQYERGNHELALLLEEMVQQQYAIPYSNVDFGGLQFVRPYDDCRALNRARGVKTRFNPDLHRLEAKGFRIRPVTTPGPSDSYEALLYRMAQGGRLRSASDDEQSYLEDTGGKPPPQDTPVGLYPIARRVTRSRAWIRVSYDIS